MSSTNSIAKDVADRLRQHIDRGEGVVTVDGGDVTVSVDVEQSERYAVGVRGIQVRPQQPCGDVRDTADRIVEQVQALDGPLTVVECDSANGRAIVRSAEPDADERGVGYWEADVQRDGTSLRRYHKDHAAPEREAVAEPMKHATAGRVAEQLADAVRSAQTSG
ncbi:MAG TPA: hypothetical protein VFZ66_02515 [Herpetosiphonaceae bacterium]